MPRRPGMERAAIATWAPPRSMVVMARRTNSSEPAALGNSNELTWLSRTCSAGMLGL